MDDKEKKVLGSELYCERLKSYDQPKHDSISAVSEYKEPDFYKIPKEFEQAWLEEKSKHDDRLDSMTKVSGLTKQEIMEKLRNSPIESFEEYSELHARAYPNMSTRFETIIENLKRTEKELINSLALIDGNHMVESVFDEPTNHNEAIDIMTGLSQRISVLTAELKCKIE